ncbi:MAG: hypothetical protein WAU75_10185 [Solirubrobacteraceae bacterium]
MRTRAVGTVLALVLCAPAAAQADTVLVENAHSGGHYAATNTTSPGGGIYQDVALNTSAGQLVCASAWLRTQLPSTGASGTFSLYLRGTSAVNGGATTYGGLGNLGNWTQAQTCVEATGSHSSLRIQLYPTPGSPTTEIDDVNVGASLAANGGFEDGGGPWAPYPGTTSNYVVYANAPGAPPAYSGTHFAATNTSSSGGGIYEDMALNTSAGQTVCGSARVRTEYPNTGASGGFALWLTGTSAHDGSSVRYSSLPEGSWSLVQTCVEATGSHTNLRVQFYPAVGSPTVEVDDVNVQESLAVNGGFEDGGGPWAPYPGTKSNYVVYANAPGAPPAYGGTHFAATNTTSGGGGIIQDIPLKTSAGQTICGSAEVRTEYPDTGATGTFALWLTGGGAHESGASTYAGLSNGASWSPVQACVEATGSHSNLRVQFYPKPGAPTTELDDVDVNESLAANGGFEHGGAPWAIYPATSSNYRVYANGQVTETVAPPPPSPVQPTPQPTPIPTPRAKHALKVKLLMKWSWRFGTTTLRSARVGRFPHSTRLRVSCKGRGCGRPAKVSAAGPKGVRRLLRRLTGHRYRAGDVLTITFTARGWKRERARITIRDGRLPRVSRA